MNALTAGLLVTVLITAVCAGGWALFNSEFWRRNRQSRWVKAIEALPGILIFGGVAWTTFRDGKPLNLTKAIVLGILITTIITVIGRAYVAARQKPSGADL